MSQEEAAKQFSFRLPESLVARVEGCMEEMREAGLDVTRADVVRILLKHALDATHCKLALVFGKKLGKKLGKKARAKQPAKPRK